MAVGLSGCAGVPSGGEPVVVRRIPPAGSVQDESDVALQPWGPLPGAGPEQLVRGFLDAAVSSDDRHGIARSFLTPTAARTWEDDETVQVFRLGPVTAVGRDVVRVTGTMVGSVGVDGSFTPAGGVLNLTYHVVEIDGSWRIANPPPGLMLTYNYFSLVYVPYSVYFLTPDGSRLVPDLRYLEKSLGNARRSRLVRLLLGGPSDWLTPGVRTSVPPGTRLRGNVVQDGDVFVVDLTGEAELASLLDRGRLSAQLVWTLRQFPITGVRIQVEGRPLDVPGVGELQETEQWAGYNPAAPERGTSAYYVSGGAVRLLRGSEDIAPIALGGAQGKTGVISAGASVDNSRLAVVKAAPGGGQELLLGPLAGPLVSRLRARQISRPTWGSSSDRVLVVLDGTALATVSVDGELTPAKAQIPRGHSAGREQIVAVRLAPDGVRAAMVVGSGEGARLLTGVLVADAVGSSVLNLRSVVTDVAGMTDVGWAKETGLFTIGRSANGEIQPWDISSDGAIRTGVSRSDLPTQGVSWIAASPAEQVLVQAGGAIYQRFFNTWGSPQANAVVGTAPFYAG
jgi:hypothetical protein